MQRVALFTGHYLGTARKAGFHWLADGFHQLGWDVLLVTTNFSWLSYLRRDYRLQYNLRNIAGHIVPHADRLSSYVWFTTWHPANLRLGVLNHLSHPLFARYGRRSLGAAEDWLRTADLFIVESTPGLLVTERLRQLNPNARFVYRVSDDLRRLRCHPVVIDAEPHLAPTFDLVSTPCEYIQQRFAHLPQAVLHPHGMPKSAFDIDTTDPYPHHDAPQCVFVGSAQFDHDFLTRAAEAEPDWQFHIIGPIANVPRRPNIHAYGEQPFADTVPYIQHADIGLQTLVYTPGAESFTDTLKVLQYTYCRLPIIAPDFLRCSRTNLCYYQPGDSASIKTALHQARDFDRNTVDPSGVRTWTELAQHLAGDS
jgi:2-beta-glucuronyltransferase